MTDMQGYVALAIGGKVTDCTRRQIIRYGATRKQWDLWHEVQGNIIQGNLDSRFSTRRNNIIENLGV